VDAVQAIDDPGNVVEQVGVGGGVRGRRCPPGPM
jgi:hypothetical protein